LEKKKILVVEDDSAIRNALKGVLESHDFEVEVARNGVDALRVLKESETEPNLILLDLMMPEMNGFDFREIQLKDQKIAHIPVILLTANNRYKEFKEKMRAYEFLNKPIEIDDLLFVINNFFLLDKR
jgi:CheY-like chemotaxis protein